MLSGVIFCVGSLMQSVLRGNEPVMFTGRAVGGLVRIRLHFYVIEADSVDIGCWRSQYAGTPVHRRDLASSNSRSSGGHLRNWGASRNLYRFLDQLWRKY
jgi:hypothetical protein